MFPPTDWNDSPPTRETGNLPVNPPTGNDGYGNGGGVRCDGRGVVAGRLQFPYPLGRAGLSPGLGLVKEKKGNNWKGRIGDLIWKGVAFLTCNLGGVGSQPNQNKTVTHVAKATEKQRQAARQSRAGRSACNHARRRQGSRESGAVNAGTTCVELAVPAFEDPPVRPRVAQVARPLDQRVVRLDHLERVRTGARRDRHLRPQKSPDFGRRGENRNLGMEGG